MGVKPANSRGSSRIRSGGVAAVAMAAALLVCTNIAAWAEDDDQSLNALQQMSIEQLGGIEVTSVSKEAQPLSDAPAAIYVITHDEIMRSGRTSLPEILRLAPNLQVAQVSANSYAITARGFNGTTTSNGAGNKLLVLIDGRSVYTPLYAGVFWDLQYVLPDDIDRIEVISGPGAALWGANAVNGVINIITKNSADTQGAFAKVQAGNLDLGASAQYGGTIGEDTTLRIYGSGFHRREDVSSTGAGVDDNWQKFQSGFRLDWAPGNSLLTVQGDIYTGFEGQPAPPDARIRGHNLLARWTDRLDGGSSLQIQAYYDYNAIYVPGSIGDSLRTFDIDAQHSFSWGEDQNIVWGGDYRYVLDRFHNIPSVKFLPANTKHDLASAFVQDTIALSDAFNLILGTKLEDDPFVGVQILPSARAAYKLTDHDLLWAAVSRAVRAPSLWDRDLNEFAGTTLFLGGGHFKEEKLLAYEAGYRAQPLSDLSFSLSAYYNVYDDLRSVELSSGPAIIEFGNRMEGDTYGLEFWGNYAVNDWWQLRAGASYEHENLHFKPGSLSPLLGLNASYAGDDPSWQVKLGSSMNITPDLMLDVNLRGVGRLPEPKVSAYAEMDVNLQWKLSDNIQLSLGGFNLLHKHHPEYLTGGGSNEIPRSILASVRWDM